MSKALDEFDESVPKPQRSQACTFNHNCNFIYDGDLDQDEGNI